MITTVRPVTRTQRELIGTLLDERVITEGVRDQLFPMLGDMHTTADASAIIAILMQQRRIDGQDTTRKTFKPTPGYYATDIGLVRVSIGSRGQWYAEMAHVPRPGDGRRLLYWQYIGKRVRLNYATKLTYAEAYRHIGYDLQTGKPL